MKNLICSLIAFLCVGLVGAQETFPVNGIADHREGSYVFTNATIAIDANHYIPKGTLVIKDGKIVKVGKDVEAPKDAVVVDCNGKFIYPSFIDIYSSYGMPGPEKSGAGDARGGGQYNSSQKGAYGWNSAIRTDVDAGKIFGADDARAKPIREVGFGTVLTHQMDGIARGTGAVVTLAAKKENLLMVKERASAHYSFSKGSSTQSYPSSLMGSIALLRQNFLDAEWYKNNPDAEGVNLTLKAFNEQQSLLQIFEANDKWNDLRAYRVGKEFGVKYILKGGGNEYQRISEMAATGATFILPINFPQAMDVEDINDVRFVSLTDMKHWELAPTNPAAFEKAGIPFCITAADLKEPKQFMENLRKSIDYGLSQNVALDALTKTPAKLLGIYDQVGSLEEGKRANFLIMTDSIFGEKSKLLQNWIQGEKYVVKDEPNTSIAGNYDLIINFPNEQKKYPLEVKSNTSAVIIETGVISTRFSFDGKMAKIDITTSDAKFNYKPDTTKAVSDTVKVRRKVSTFVFHSVDTRLGGTYDGSSFQGTGVDSNGSLLTWTATLTKPAEVIRDSTKKKEMPATGKVTYPMTGYGYEQLPAQETVLIKNATVWTNEQEGVLENTDVLVNNGKIAAIGKGLNDSKARLIDGTGKHLTAGIIDEHSHIAAMSVNEGAQSVTSEVRIGDNLNPEDVNIYRQLSGGVTTSHILHGSANTIGGQTQLIKLRWGSTDEQLKFEGADPFIKFALGENVKHTGAPNNTRFPDTRMGVNEVLNDAFTRASDYEKAMKSGRAKLVRRDLELDALLEIMRQKRFITCHSYVQSEITATMRVAEKFGFRINTFTHILEGYKVADKMKAHGANASSFSDWWAYKTEVQDAIPYNASIMTKVGLNVAINSDDAEMARRLNQEAAKSVKYGGLSEEDALKLVTLNPAKMLHVDNRVGSIKTGKDADLVLWSDNPLSIYARASYTIVDGVIYFDRDKDVQMRKAIQTERYRLVLKMLKEKKAGAPVSPAAPSAEIINTCDDHEKAKGILVIDNEGL